MISKRLLLFAGIAALVVLFTGMAIGLAATNLVPGSRMSDQTFANSVGDLAPPECNSIKSGLTSIVQCTGGNCNGSDANELILGSSGSDHIKGKKGDDCIVGGGGDDDLSGDQDNDVCIGGPGNDTFKACETEIQ